MLVLIGDSHFSRARLLIDATNVAVGGATTKDLGPQVAQIPEDSSTIVVSIGTNDAAEHNHVSPEEFSQLLRQLFSSLPEAAKVFFMASPGVVETRPAGALWTSERIASYRDVARRECAFSGVEFIALHEVLAPLGDEAFDSDGLHLSPKAYGVVLGILKGLGSVGE